MSYAGTVLDAIKRMKANRDLQTSRRKSNQDRLISLSLKTNSSLEFNECFIKETTALEKEQLKTKLKHKKRKLQVLTRFCLCLTIIFSFILIYIFFC